MATNSQIAFNPQGETVVVAAAAVAPLGVQVPVYQKFSDHVAGQMRIVNASANRCRGTGQRRGSHCRQPGSQHPAGSWRR
jgi:hypothetical protein